MKKQPECLQMLRRVIFNGWPATRQELPAAATAYWDVRDEVSAYNGIVYKGEIIVIPKSLRAEMLDILHSSHSRVVATKQKAP